MNWKRPHRIYRGERQTLRIRSGRKQALGMRAPMAIPQDANQHWSHDFVSDVLVDCRRFRILYMLDDFSRECLASVVDDLLSGDHAARELLAIAQTRSYPCMVLNGNGTELTSNAMFSGQRDHGVEWHYIAPGKRKL